MLILMLLYSESPRLSGRRTVTDNGCMQEVTVSLQQPVPDEMHYAFSSEETDCVDLRGIQEVDIATDKSELPFAVNVGDSGLDTRLPIYLISWYVMKDTMGPCSNNILLQRTSTLGSGSQFLSPVFMILTKYMHTSPLPHLINSIT